MSLRSGALTRSFSPGTYIQRTTLTLYCASSCGQVQLVWRAVAGAAALMSSAKLKRYFPSLPRGCARATFGRIHTERNTCDFRLLPQKKLQFQFVIRN
ncbi:hypothetical protein evm_010486 [Chilo suppressalis]|nr:hypothetical protein evm_010486 [Chilo suppressalis]